MITILDYRLGNLASVRNAFRKVGAEAELTADPQVIERADGIVLPGVGAASAGMERMQERGLVESVMEAAERGTPILGLCLGMQLLFDRSEEGDVACLGLLPGVVRRIQGDVKVPHIGWNEVDAQGKPEIFAGIPAGSYFYFVHSYVCVPEDRDAIAGVTQYGERFCSAVAQGSIWGTQFHPERSGEMGLRLIGNFAALCGAGAPAPSRAL